MHMKTVTSTQRERRARPLSPLVVTRVRKTAGVRTSSATVLFADLRGYTALAEQLAADRVVPLLDEFFRVLEAATAAHQGTIFHMVGDGIMAGFGLHDESGGARHALAAGQAMLQSFAPIAERWHDELSIQAGIGIGLHLGNVAVWALGPPRQKSTTLVGDTVNVAARLCSRARAGEVLFSCAVAAALDNDKAAPDTAAGAAPFLQLPQFELRGRRNPIDIWCVPAAKRLSL
jgi:adenylate cyclase